MRNGRGFTLIELLIVVVIMGILVSVLIPRWANSKDRAFQAAMKSDLRNLATAQESYFYDYATYTTSLTALNGFRASAAVSVTINQATMAGWSATASHTSASKRCYLYIGNASPVGGATVEGQVSCQ